MSPTKPQHQPKPATCEACSSKQAVQLIQASKGFSNHVCGPSPERRHTRRNCRSVSPHVMSKLQPQLTSSLKPGRAQS